MIRWYRKYLEPAYGDIRPEVIVPPVQNVDFSSGNWRIRYRLETIAELMSLIKPCSCYEPLMTIRTTDTHLRREGAEIPLRLYHPEGEGPFPILVFYHGGGWSMNDLDIYDWVPRYFAKFGGVAVVAADYRLAPEHRFPTGLEDAYAALEWSAAHAAEFCGCTDSITVCGDSAGGNLAAAVSLMARDRGGPSIHKQILIYPATIFRPERRTDSELRYGGGGYFIDINTQDGGMCPHYFEDLKDMDCPYASPLEAESLRGLPPACFISAECDPLLDQALMYAARLEDEGVPVEYHLYSGMLHAFLNRTYQKTFEALDDIIAAVPRLRQN